jgi:hypothetical protein
MRLIKHISYVGLNRSSLCVTKVVLPEATVLVAVQEQHRGLTRKTANLKKRTN